MAAAMSTFTSIINSSSAYWVRDIYQTFINPNASEQKLVLQSRLASIVIVALGVGGSYLTTNIIDVWGYLCLAFVGLFIPRVLRWYWWRFNGWGFTWGTAVGSVAAIALRWFPELGEVEKFCIASGTSIVAAIVATLATRPTEFSVLENFYKVTRPFGVWGKVRKGLSPSQQKRVLQENARDLFSIVVAVPWQLSLFLSGMLLVMKRWEQFAMVAVVFLFLSIVLYFSWFRNLRNEEDLQNTDLS
jgi:Na+/proline symporter